MSLENDIKILRKMIWLNHGHHPSQLYGDDGEMQCHECFREYGFYDWKNTPVKEINQRIKLAVLLARDFNVINKKNYVERFFKRIKIVHGLS